MEIFINPSVEMILSLLSVALLLGGILLLLDSIWRVEDHFDHYLKCMAVIFTLFLLKKVLMILGFEGFSYWSFTAHCFDLVMTTLFFVAQFKLFHLIRELSGENKI